MNDYLYSLAATGAPFILMGVCLLILLFLLARELLTWYWKINEIVILLGKIEENTRSKNRSISERYQNPNAQGAEK